MKRTLAILTFLILSVPGLVASEAAGDTTDDDRGRLDVALDLFRDARAARDAAKERQATDYLEDHILAASLVDTTWTREAWAQILRSPAPAATYAAEAVLWDLVRKNVEAALATGQTQALDLWMGLAFARTDRDGWSVPGWTAERAAAPHAQNITNDLMAVMASRARETLVTALLLHHAGDADAATATLDGAAALLSVFHAQAGQRLPTALAGPFLENATRGADLLADIPSDRNADAWPGLMAPLVALELDRDIEPLDVFAMRNVDAVSVALRAAEEAPGLRAALSEQAWLQYGADRPGLFLRGEGTMDATDDAYETLRDLDADAPVAALRTATVEVRDRLTDVGLLMRGIVLKVEIGGVRPDRTHEYQVTLVRPPLDGVARFHLNLTYDASIIEIVGAEPFGPHDHAEHDHDAPMPGWNVTSRPGSMELTIRPATPVQRSAHVVTLFLEARGPQGSMTPLTVEEAWFEEPDGDRAVLETLRHGQATVTEMPAQKGEEAPGPAVVALVALMAVLVWARRRSA